MLATNLINVTGTGSYPADNNTFCIMHNNTDAAILSYVGASGLLDIGTIQIPIYTSVDDTPSNLYPNLSYVPLICSIGLIAIIAVLSFRFNCVG